MSKKALIQKNVKRAFAYIGDLAKIAVFSQTPSTGFNFTTQTVESGTTVTLAAKGVLLERKKDRDGDYYANFILDASDAPSLDTYATAVIDGVNYKVVHPLKNDGFLITIKLVEVTSG